MTKKMWSLLLTGALIAGVFSAVPAQAAPEIPTTVNIEDPAGDSNGLNDQGDGATFGDNTGGVNFVAGDFLKVWFSTTDKLNVHILTSAPGGGGNWAMRYRIFANDGCDWFQGTVGGKSNADAAPTAFITDNCDRGLENLPGEITVEPLEDGTGVTTLSFPLGTWPGLEQGATLTAPSGITRIANPAAVVPQMDTTKVGTDYVIGGGAAPVQPPVVQEPPGKNDPPGQGNQNCAKIKDKKKKKACKKNSGKTPPGDKCAAYTPGEQGAEAETLVVDSKASAEAPVEHQISMDPAVGLLTGTLPVVNQPNPATSETFINLQVDSDKPTDGLYVRVEFTHGEDYDIYLNNADGTEAARAGGFNQHPDPNIGDGTGNGGHAEETAEQLDGVLTNDCGGYTLKIANALGTGEPVLKLWLGDPTWDPGAQAAIPAKAFIL